MLLVYAAVAKNITSVVASNIVFWVIQARFNKAFACAIDGAVSKLFFE